MADYIASAGWDRDDELALAHDFISSLDLERQWGMHLVRAAAEEAGKKAS